MLQPEAARSDLLLNGALVSHSLFYAYIPLLLLLLFCLSSANSESQPANPFLTRLSFRAMERIRITMNRGKVKCSGDAQNENF